MFHRIKLLVCFWVSFIGSIGISSEIPDKFEEIGIGKSFPISIGGGRGISLLPPMGWKILEHIDQQKYIFESPQKISSQNSKIKLPLRMHLTIADEMGQVIDSVAAIKKMKNVKEQLLKDLNISTIKIVEGYKIMELKSRHNFMTLNAEYSKNSLRFKRLEGFGASTNHTISLSFEVPKSEFKNLSPVVLESIKSLNMPGGSLGLYGGIDKYLIYGLIAVVSLIVILALWGRVRWWNQERKNAREFGNIPGVFQAENKSGSNPTENSQNFSGPFLDESPSLSPVSSEKLPTIVSEKEELKVEPMISNTTSLEKQIKPAKEISEIKLVGVNNIQESKPSHKVPPPPVIKKITVRKPGATAFDKKRSENIGEIQKSSTEQYIKDKLDQRNSDIKKRKDELNKKEIHLLLDRIQIDLKTLSTLIKTDQNFMADSKTTHTSPSKDIDA